MPISEKTHTYINVGRVIVGVVLVTTALFIFTAAMNERPEAKYSEQTKTLVLYLTVAVLLFTSAAGFALTLYQRVNPPPSSQRLPKCLICTHHPQQEDVPIVKPH